MPNLRPIGEAVAPKLREATRLLAQRTEPAADQLGRLLLAVTLALATDDQELLDQLDEVVNRT